MSTTPVRSPSSAADRHLADEANGAARQLNVAAPNPRDIWAEALNHEPDAAFSIDAVEETLTNDAPPFNTPEHFAAAILETVEAQADRATMVLVRRMLASYADAFNQQSAIRSEAGFLLGFACGTRAAIVNPAPKLGGV